MVEFLSGYGFLILLVVVFLAMHWFGMGCGTGHRHGSSADGARANPGEEKKQT